MKNVQAKSRLSSYHFDINVGFQPRCGRIRYSCASTPEFEFALYYDKHLFFCTNRRPDDADRPSCARCGSPEMRGWTKARIKQLGLAGPGGVRVNTAGCLDRCELGPVLVVYPEGVWYTYIDEQDVEEIIQSHVIGGRPVERLRLPDTPEA